MEDYELARIDALIARDEANGRRLRMIWEMIIVDEGQDISDASWRLIDWLSGSGTTLYAIDGKHQLLYRKEAGQFLTETLPQLTPAMNLRRKRRVFRTMSETFLLGQLWVSAYPAREEGEKQWQRHRIQYVRAKNKEQQNELDFELSRPHGTSPKLIAVAEADEAAIVELLKGLMTRALQRLSALSSGVSFGLIDSCAFC